MAHLKHFMMFQYVQAYFHAQAHMLLQYNRGFILIIFFFFSQFMAHLCL